MKSTSEQVVESIISSFKAIDKEDQMCIAIELIVAIANEGGASYCESVGIIESAKSELRELLNKTPQREVFTINSLNNNQLN
jgi:hypothetical protein